MTEACRVCPGRLVEEAGRLMGTSLSDIVPPQAQLHLFNAQRELLLAIAVTLEHNTARAGGGRRGSGAKSKRASRTPSRVELE